MQVVVCVLLLCLAGIAAAQNSDPLPVEPGDTVCSPGEFCVPPPDPENPDCPCPNAQVPNGNCIADVCVGCGDGTCSEDEDCLSCPGDCDPQDCAPRCGDYECRNGENCENCPEDCPCNVAFGAYFCQHGVCTSNCGDGICSGVEDCDNCYSDCAHICVGCGDGDCSGSEDCAGCPSDCGCPFNEECITGTCEPRTCRQDGVCSSFEGCFVCPEDCACTPIAPNADTACNNVTLGTCVPVCNNATTCGNWMAACVAGGLSITDCLAEVANVWPVNSDTSVITTYEVLPECPVGNNLCLVERNVASQIASPGCLNISSNLVWVVQQSGTVATVSFIADDSETADELAARFELEEEDPPGCSASIEGLAGESFSGTFQQDVDSFSLLHCCIRAERLYCALDQFLLIQADLFDNYTRAEGAWWSGGLGGVYNVSCLEGTVQMLLGTDTIPGNETQVELRFACVEDPFTLTNVTYNRRRGSALGPQTTECAALSEDPNLSVQGVWNASLRIIGEGRVQVGDELDLCVDSDGTYTASYDTNDGRDSGLVRDTNKVASGYYVSCQSRGVSLYFLLEDGRLGNFWWATSPSQDINEILNRNVPYLHGYDVFSTPVDDDGNPISDSPSNDDCDRNEDTEFGDCISDDEGDDDEGDDEGGDDEGDGDDDGVANNDDEYDGQSTNDTNVSSASLIASSAILLVVSAFAAFP